MKKFLLTCTVTLLQFYFSRAQQNNSFSDKWYEEAVANLQQLQYDFYTGKNNQSFRAVNSASRLSFELRPLGYKAGSIRGSDPDNWTVDFSVKAIGRHNTPVTIQSDYKLIKKTGNIIYRFSEMDIEYTNSERGLRQNFIVNEKPAGKGKLTVTMKVKTDLVTSLINNTLSFYDEKSNTKLTYSDLKVWDANYTELPSHMTYNTSTGELKLVADDSEAVYPVTIDPLNQSPEWNTSVDGLLSSFLTNVQMKTALYGFAVSALGDVNGDGFDDAAISAPGLVDVFSGTGTLADVGAVFVYYGSASGLSTTPAKTLQPTTAVAGALFGFSVTGGDVTGDAINDIIISAPLDRYSVTLPDIVGSSAVNVTAGKVYIYEGNSSTAANPSPFLQVKLGASFFSRGILGLHSNINVNALFGFSIAATDDLNGDGKQDLVIGAPAYVGTNALAVQNGNTFVYYSGNLNTTTPVELSVPSPSMLGLVQLPVLSSSGLLFGYSVDGVGDYNGDGHPDIVVGAPAGIDLSSLGGVLTGKVLGGSAYVYYGTGTGINSSIGATLHGKASGLLGSAANLFGYKVRGVRTGSGLRNGNILIGAPTGGLISNALGLSIQTGNVHLFKKQSSSPASAVTADQVLESPKSSSLLQVLNTMQLNVLFGASIDNAYDINCDGFSDLVIGEPLSTGTNISQLQTSTVGGAAYIYYGIIGGTYNPTPIYDVVATYGGDFMSVNATALFGFSVAGIPKTQGPASKPRILVGSPSGALDFNNSVLNLGSTIGTLLNFPIGNNGLGKSYVFNPQLCGSVHTLPAKLTNFGGQGIEKKVLLNWNTTAEENINEYVVEKSTDGSSFSTMAYILAKGNAGVNTYEMIDFNPLLGVNYYRLRIVSTDKSFTYSNVIKIKFRKGENTTIDISPNPVTANYKVKLSGLERGSYMIEIKNNQGQSFLKKSIIINEEEFVENMTKTNTMAAGIYSIHVYDANNTQVKSSRFVIR